MYGLPRQTTEGVVRMVEQAATLDPGRVALFGYAHVPWMKSHQKLIDEAALPDAAERFRQAKAAAAELQALGFVAVGLDHFARPDDDLAKALADDRLHRNFQGYTTDEAPVLLGLGASAIGALPDGYAQNTAPLKDYADAVAAGRLPIARGIVLTCDDRPRREIIERLMCALSVDLAAVRRRLWPRRGRVRRRDRRARPRSSTTASSPLIAGGWRSPPSADRSPASSPPPSMRISTGARSATPAPSDPFTFSDEAARCTALRPCSSSCWPFSRRRRPLPSNQPAPSPACRGRPRRRCRPVSPGSLYVGSTILVGDSCRRPKEPACRSGSTTAGRSPSARTA